MTADQKREFLHKMLELIRTGAKEAIRREMEIRSREDALEALTARQVGSEHEPSVLPASH